MGVILGTAAYMSPEQAKGKPVDRRADIWAFGVVLFEMLTGKSLYAGGTAPEVLACVIERDPDLHRLPASVPRKVRELIRRCLMKDPRQRLRDIGEARIAIDDHGAEPSEDAAAIPNSGIRNPKWAGIAAGVLALALMVLAAIHWRALKPS